MNRCRDCKFWMVETRWGSHNVDGRLGTCSRWKRGYNFEMSEIPFNEVWVEDDEGWAALMGPDFGCVLWEGK